MVNTRKKGQLSQIRCSVWLSDVFLPIPDVPEVIQPLVAVVPLQLLAYHVALLRGCDIDKPRNLAKSVTVE